MQFILLTKSSAFIIGPIATLLGYIMNAIFMVTSQFGLINIGVGIIIFTIIVKLIMTPLTVQQQKFSKMNTYMQPEIQAIQDKYQGKKDNESVLKQNNEMQAVYQKYGVKPTGSCLQLLIQFPILFALYRVIYNVPAYVNIVKEVYLEVADQIMAIADYAANEDFITLATSNSITADDLATTNKLIDMMYNFDSNEWVTLQEIFPSLQITDLVTKIENMNSFLGISLFNSPWEYVSNFSTYGISAVIVAVCIPVLAGLTQWVSVKISSAQQQQPEKKKMGQKEEEGTMAQSMKMMNNILPIMSVVFCFMFSTCIGVYWIMSSLMTLIIQVLVNRYMDKMDINDVVKKNMEKVNAKRAKQGLPPQKISTVANMTTKTVNENKELTDKRKQSRDDKIKQSTEYYKNSSSNPNSLSAKANMVKMYDERKEAEKKKK